MYRSSELVATGALLRYRTQGQLGEPLARQLIAATLPGVVIGAVIRMYLVPDVTAFRLIAAAVLLPLGVWLCARSAPRRSALAVGWTPAGLLLGRGGSSGSISSQSRSSTCRCWFVLGTTGHDR